MPRYKVLEPGYFGDVYYHPTGKRPVLETDTPFTKKNPMPKWLGEMPKETAAQKKKRKAVESLQAEADKLKAEADNEEIAAASTEGDGEETSFISKVKNAVSGKNSNVETL